LKKKKKGSNEHTIGNSPSNLLKRVSSFKEIGCKGVYQPLPQGVWKRSGILTKDASPEASFLKQNETPTIYNPFSYIIAYNILLICVAREGL
jgi:hypothetical protein